jgi:DNA-binding FrmR family transcriptional regulator
MPTTKHIVDHISRLEGQLSAIKKEMQQEQPDCHKVSKTLLSAARSFAGLRSQCMESMLRAHFMSTQKGIDEALFTQVLSITKG